MPIVWQYFTNIAAIYYMYYYMYYNKFDSMKSLGYVTDMLKYHSAGIGSMD